jgi:HEAT repeat protein
VGRSTAHAVASDAAEKNSDALKRLRSGGRLARRSPKAIAEALARIIALVKQHKEGLRAEQIREQLGMHPKEMPRVLKEGLSSKRLRAKGYKRATTYFA